MRYVEQSQQGTFLVSSWATDLQHRLLFCNVICVWTMSSQEELKSERKFPKGARSVNPVLRLEPLRKQQFWQT